MLFGIDKVTKYHIDAPLYVTTFVWVMNKARYEGLSAGQKKVVDDHCTTEWAIRFASPLGGFRARRRRQKMRAEPGHVADRAVTAEQLALVEVRRRSR